MHNMEDKLKALIYSKDIENIQLAYRLSKSIDMKLSVFKRMIKQMLLDELEDNFTHQKNAYGLTLKTSLFISSEDLVFDLKIEFVSHDYLSSLEKEGHHDWVVLSISSFDYCQVSSYFDCNFKYLSINKVYNNLKGYNLSTYSKMYNIVDNYLNHVCVGIIKSLK